MPYNGHKNWNHWNISLWINNDESLYRLARYYIRHSKTRNQAAESMLQDLILSSIRETPDGAPYTKTAIRAAMVGL